MHPVEEQVLRTSAEHGLFVPGAPALLMVSGGSDSTALLVLACRLRSLLGFGELQVLHVHHGLRGADADADARFVKAACERLDVPCSVRHVDVARIARAERGNVEAVGRRERYRLAGQLLDELCDVSGVERACGRIVCAHTADDRVETFLMRAIVGTGPGGLASIRRRAGRVARPLLDLGRDDLRAYLRATCEPLDPGGGGERWREDATNGDVRRFRAFVRHRVVPPMEQRNPSLRATLCRTMDHVEEEDDLLEEQVDRLVPELVRVEGDTDLLDAGRLSETPLALRRRLLRRVLAGRLPQGARLDSFHIDTVAREGTRPGFSLMLPGGLLVRNESGVLVVGAERRDRQPEPGWLALPGRWVGERGVCLSATPATVPARLAATPSWQAYVDVGGRDRLWVRPPMPGDRMEPLGMGGHGKKVADILADAKVPRHLRAQVPVVCTDDGPGGIIIWLAGLCVDERFRVPSHATTGVLLTLVGGSWGVADSGRRK